MPTVTEVLALTKEYYARATRDPEAKRKLVQLDNKHQKEAGVVQRGRSNSQMSASNSVELGVNPRLLFDAIGACRAKFKRATTYRFGKSHELNFGGGQCQPCDWKSIRSRN